MVLFNPPPAGQRQMTSLDLCPIQKENKRTKLWQINYTVVQLNILIQPINKQITYEDDEFPAMIEKQTSQICFHPVFCSAFTK